MDFKNNTSKYKSEINTSQRAIGKLIEFLDKYLPEFPALFKKKTANTNIKGEDAISEEVWEYLQSIAQHTRKIFMFQFQRKERGSTRSSDFGVLIVKPFNISPSKEFFRIEAKRLPTPGTDKDGNSREREYVQSDAGGIQRYKKGFHAPDLPQSAIIGYIQKENCSHWHKKINEWIQQLIPIKKADIDWNAQDLLVHSADFSTTQKYVSTNTRIVNSPPDSILLWHYLMELV
ncbi:MAG TPA: hypothetical protein PKE69_07925 [Pyrinomonadaceae bacterium]|nr:hypothetical protein [Pyrinomonadaceae bacterium]